MSRLFVLPACLTLLYLMTGCSPPPAPTPVPQTQTVDEHPEHEHSHGAGPHGGTMVDWGGGAYHVEFTVEHEKKEATIYVLDSDEKSPRPIKADKIQLVINDPETEMELIAQPLEGEAAGSSSRFVGTHDTIGIEKEFAGTITGLIEGTPYTGDFKEEPHGAVISTNRLMRDDSERHINRQLFRSRRDRCSAWYTTIESFLRKCEPRAVSGLRKAFSGVRSYSTFPHQDYSTLDAMML